MATTYQIKTKNQIYKEFKTFIETALSEYSITNWNVKKLHQIIKTEELQPCIFIQILNKKQAGAQYRTQNKVNDIYYKNSSSKQEINIRFSATRRELMNDTVDTMNGVDILTLIRAYFQTLNGIKMLSDKGYAQYRASDVSEQSFTNDDENIQLMPYFDCTYLYTENYKNPIYKIDKIIENKIIGV